MSRQEATRIAAAFTERRRAGDLNGDGFVRLADVVEREVDWYWNGRIARGNVVVVAGDGGVGKSTLVQALGAAQTRGSAFPGGDPGPPRGVVILSAEEDMSAVVRPRMRLMGADLERVVVLDIDEAGLTLPSGAERLEARCRAEDAGLLVIDTGPAFLDPGLKSNSEEDVRHFLAPLRAIAERLRMVVIVLAHLNKDTSRSAGGRIMGGAAWRNAPRQVLMVGAPPGEDPRETGERLVAVEKNNLGVYPPAVSFRLAPAPGDPSRAVIVWGNEVQGVSASDLVGEPKGLEERSALAEAVEWLRGELADGERPAGEIQDAAEAAGISKKTLRSAAAEQVKVVRRRVGFGAGGAWWWSLPIDAPAPGAPMDEAHDGHLCERAEANGVLASEVQGPTSIGALFQTEGTYGVGDGWERLETLVEGDGVQVVIERRDGGAS